MQLMACALSPGVAKEPLLLAGRPSTELPGEE